MRADEIMTERVVTIRATQKVADAIEVLAEHRIRHLPVVGDAGQLVGMITDRDLRGVGVPRLFEGESLARLRERLDARVSDVMSADVATVGPEAALVEIIDCMLEENVGAVPVVDDDTDRLVGIVSYVDVLRAVREELE